MSGLYHFFNILEKTHREPLIYNVRNVLTLFQSFGKLCHLKDTFQSVLGNIRPFLSWLYWSRKEETILFHDYFDSFVSLKVKLRCCGRTSTTYVVHNLDAKGKTLEADMS